jgi:hypothetical protein
MPLLNEIVDVEITRESRGITRVGFNTPLLLSFHSRFAEVVRTYSSLSGMVADGFLTSDNAYKMANSVFAQADCPDEIKVGRLTTAVAQVNTLTPTVVNSFLYTVTINGILYSYTSDGTATAAEIVTGINAAINAGTEPVTASGTVTVILTSDTAGAGFSLSLSANWANVATTPNNGIVEDLQLISAVDDDFYAVVTETANKDKILDLARYIEATEKIYFATTADAAVIAGTEDNVVDRLNELAYDRSVALYSADANFPSCAWIGTRLAQDPGSATWMFPTLVGINASSLSTTQSGNVRTPFGNTYETFAGRNIVRNGTVASGEYVDVIIGIDYLTQRIREDVFEALANAKKIPYTDAGVAIIESVLRARLTDGINKGILASFTITVPKVASISSVDKAARLLPDVVFTGVLAGAIHKVEIAGRVSV